MPNRPPKIAAPPPPPLRPARGPLTGLMIARASGAKIVIGQSGDDCAYSWRERIIVLSPEVARGTDIYSLLVASEEAAHHAQPRVAHVFRWFGLVRLWEEYDAFRRVKRFFRSLHVGQ